MMAMTKKQVLVALFLACGVVSTARPAAAHWSVSIGIPSYPVVIARPPCGYPYSAYSPYPAYPAYYPYPVPAYPYPYPYPAAPYAFDYYGGPGLHRYGQPRYFDNGWQYGQGFERRPTAHGYTFR